MLIKNQLISMVAGLLLVTHSAIAQEGTTWFGQPADGQWLVGIKAGQITDDDPGRSDADVYSIVIGYQFAREVGTNGTASIEFEYFDSDDANTNSGFPGTTWDARGYGLFFTYRTPGTVYFKARAGLLSSDLREEVGSVRLATSRDTSFAYGAGLGLVLGQKQNVNLELDWTGTSGDNDISLVQLGGLVKF